MFSSLREIRGVGEKARAEIISAYGSEARALKELSSLRFYRLFSSNVMPAKQADIAREIFSRVAGVEYAEMLATPEARQLYAQVLEALRREACTGYAKAKLSLFYPVASEKSLAVLRRDVAAGERLARALGMERLRALRQLLSGLSYLKPPRSVRIASQVVAVEDDALYQELASRYRGMVEVLLVESPEDLEAMRGYELVRYVDSGNGHASMLMGAANVEMFPGFSEPEVLPEVTLSFFQENLDTIETCAKVLGAVGEERLRGFGKEHLSGGELERIAEQVKGLKEENPYAYASAKFALEAEACVEEANREVERRVERQGLAIRGAEMLNMLTRLSSSPEQYLPEELREVIAEVAEEYEAELAERLHLSSEALRFAGLLSSQVSYPLVLSRERRAELESWLSNEASRRSFAAKRELASRLASSIPKVKRSVELALELDYLLALGSFCLRYSAAQAKVGKDMRLHFVNARHLLLSASSQPQPVSYELGYGGRIAVITGANSGGKTTLLETIAQVQIMAQSGLPVLAEQAEVPIVQRLYFFAKRRGESGAGAFESLLRSFAGIVTRGGERRLVLADEIEAVTEPGAAAKIIGALLEWFSRDDATLVAVVTHLGEELLSLGIEGMRIDGIEAKGLDENLNLIVDRNPVLGRLARSTPELILERLSRKSGEDFYTFLLRRFRDRG
ncbi:MutS-related protein [Candidatus Pyrohabitans sp.]